jgi:hypothetical protein
MRKYLVLLVFTVLTAPAAMAFNPQPEPPGFGAIGIVSSQTARLNVFFAPQPSDFPPGPCTGMIQLRFYDAAGNVVAQRSARLAQGAEESLEFAVSARDVAPTTRTQIRADISWVTYPPGPCRQELFGNVEVYSNETGATQFVLPGFNN